VNLEWESALFGRGAFLQVLTPVEPLTLRMIHHVYCQRWLPTIVAKFFLYAEALMVGHKTLSIVCLAFISFRLLLLLPASSLSENNSITDHREIFLAAYIVANIL